MQKYNSIKKLEIFTVTKFVLTIKRPQKLIKILLILPFLQAGQNICNSLQQILHYSNSKPVAAPGLNSLGREGGGRWGRWVRIVPAYKLCTFEGDADAKAMTGRRMPHTYAAPYLCHPCWWRYCNKLLFGSDKNSTLPFVRFNLTKERCRESGDAELQ